MANCHYEWRGDFRLKNRKYLEIVDLAKDTTMSVLPFLIA